jgi:hypothetical protein
VAIVVVALIAALCVSGCFGGGNEKTTSASPRQVAQLLLLKEGTQGKSGLSVLLAKHGPRDVFSPGDWVFPSGAAPNGQSGDEAARVAAVAGLEGQVGIKVKPSDLVPYAQWVVPGFDTRFYLALAPKGAVPQPNGTIAVDAGWFEPEKALAMSRQGDLPLGYPTIKQLQSLTGFSTPADAIDTAEKRGVTPVQLRIIGQGDKRRPVLPEDAPQG